MRFGARLQHWDHRGTRPVHLGLRLQDWGRRRVLATVVVPIMVVAAMLLGLSGRRITISPAFLFSMFPARRVPVGAPVMMFAMVFAMILAIMVAVPISMMVPIPAIIAVVVFGPVMVVAILIVIGERWHGYQA